MQMYNKEIMVSENLASLLIFESQHCIDAYAYIPINTYV